VFGKIYRLKSAPKIEDSTIDAMFGVTLDEEDQEIYKQEKSVDFGYSIHGRRFRLNVSRQR
jgi:Tfp pilus assembly pilus retraction ATPase PilT